MDFANGDTFYCAGPLTFDTGYRVCGGNGKLGGQIYNGRQWVFTPTDDPRCNKWGGPYSAQFLACEAALPPLTQGQP
jgi:hypothetical protein